MKKANIVLFSVFLFGASNALVYPQSLSVTKVGEWGTGPYQDVFVRGNYAYCAANAAGLDIIDISSPLNPVKIGNCDTPGWALGVYVSGSYAYVADGRSGLWIKEGSGLRIINVSNPAAPTLAGSYDTPDWAYGVFVSGSYAYVADYEKGLLIINISNPAAPTLAGSYDTPGFAQGIYVSGSYAYIADGGSGLQIINVSNPAAPTLASFYHTPVYAQGIYVSGSYAYVADSESGLQIINVSNPAAPTRAGSYRTPLSAEGIYVSGSYAYVASNGLQIVDVSNPAAPTLTGSYETFGSARGVFVSGSYAYVAGGESGLQIVNISNPAVPTLAGFYDTSGYISDVSISGSYAYAAAEYCGLLIINISNLAAPTLAGSSHERSDYGYSAVYVNGSCAYMVETFYGLHIINISNPAAPTLVGSYDTPGYAEGVFVSGSYAYLTDHDIGLHIINISNPAAPTLAGSYYTPDAQGIYVSGSYAYLTDHESGLHIINISNPAAPTLAGSYDTPGRAQGIYVSGSYAYVADEGSGLQIINVSNPAAPTRAGSYDTPGSALGVFVSGSYAYVADGVSGKLIILSVAVAPAVTSPNGGESWDAGSWHSITWTADASLGPMKIEYSTDNGATWTTIAASTPNDGSYSWAVPNTPSPNCLVRVSEFDGSPSDTSDAVFTIAAVVSSTITVISPNGGENWALGSSHDITWMSTGDVGDVKIEYSTDGGGSYSTIVASTANDGTHPWTVPNTPSTNCLVRISEAVTGGSMDVSNSVFSINAAPPTISLSRINLFYGSSSAGISSKTQSVIVSNSGGGTLNWTAIPQQGWINVTPASGTGTRAIDVSVNVSNLGIGTHTGSIVVSDPSATNSPRSINVTLKVYDAGATTSPFGYFETPVDWTAGIEGSVPVTGWVLDDVEVTKVDIWRDPVSGEPVHPNGYVYIGDAVFVEGARPDVEAAYPTYPLNYRAGWGYMMLTNFLPGQGNGTYRIHAIAYDKEGHSTKIGTKTITCDNAHATLPFGAIDTPAQGGTWNGTQVNFGWALTPMPKSIPIDGATIWLWIDGLPVGHPTYNNYRSDIATLFPGFANSNGAVGYYYVDTTQYANGVHTIAWSVEDSAGKASGIGSRYFTVVNTGTGSAAGLAEPSSVPISGELSFDQVTSPTRYARIPTDHLSPVYFKRGYNLEALSEAIFPDSNGVVNVEAREVDRIEVALGEDAAGVSLKERVQSEKTAATASARTLGKILLQDQGLSALIGGRGYAGYLVIGSELRPLPIGSTLDPQRGFFSWQLGPGFVGEYNFVFIRQNGVRVKKNISVRVLPLFQPKGSSGKTPDPPLTVIFK